MDNWGNDWYLEKKYYADNSAEYSAINKWIIPFRDRVEDYKRIDGLLKPVPGGNGYAVHELFAGNRRLTPEIILVVF